MKPVQCFLHLKINTSSYNVIYIHGIVIGSGKNKIFRANLLYYIVHHHQQNMTEG